MAVDLFPFRPALRNSRGAYVTGIFRDTGVETAIGIDGVRETMILILGAGVTGPNPEQETIMPVGPDTVLPRTLSEDAG